MNFFCPHQNVHSAYYPQTTKLKLGNVNLDVSLLFLYSHVRKPDKNHQYTIKVHYPQPVECRSYKLKRTVDPKLNLQYAFSILMINFLFERYDTYHLIVLSVKPKKEICLIKCCGRLYQ